MLETLLTWKIVAPATILGLAFLYAPKYWRRWRLLFFMGGCFERPRKSKTRNNPTNNSPGYLGLRNEGSTCYLNSILQCLFMTPDFTNNILRFPGPVFNHVKVFQMLFLKLQYTSSPPSTLDLMHCFGIQEGRQQDVEEHFRILINSLPQEFQQLFRIQMVHSLTCKGCKHEDVIQNPVLCLSLAISDSEPSVNGALQDFHEKNILDLDNQCYCSVCRRKEDADSRHYFTDLPKILVVHLKRYKICEGRFEKIFGSVFVPYSLTVPVEKSQANSVNYTLFALCNHYGGLRGGHYIAEIKSFDDEHWYAFNDKLVKKLCPRSKEKGLDSDSAYLLMYYQEQEKQKFLEKEDLPPCIQRFITDCEHLQDQPVLNTDSIP